MKKKANRRTKSEESEPPVSRLNEFIAFFGKDYNPVMPVCKAAHLVKYFQELGRIKLEGMSEIPLDWQSLFYWMKCTKRDLKQWELSALIEMSGEYLIYKNDPDAVKYPFDNEFELRDQLIEVQSAYNKARKQEAETNK